jgi:ribonuclease Z
VCSFTILVTYDSQKVENSMRRLLVVAALMVASAVARAEGPEITVTLLGTGSPIPEPLRAGPATLVQAGGQNLLFDAGRTVTTRLYQLKVPFREVTPIFITHYHSDHINGLPDLWLTGWLGGPWARRTSPLHVIGPTGLRELTDNLTKAYAADIRIRTADEHYPLSGVTFKTEEFERDGVIYEREGLRVTAFEVDHGDEIKPAYGYRIDYRGRSVVISGDTRMTESVVKYGTGADLLIHEVCAARPEVIDEQAKAVMAHHTSPSEAGMVFSRAKPKLAAFTHIVLIARPNVPAPTIDEVVSQTRNTYDGPLVVGEDLMSFRLTNEGVTVSKRRE